MILICSISILFSDDFTTSQKNTHLLNYYGLTNGLQEMLKQGKQQEWQKEPNRDFSRVLLVIEKWLWRATIDDSELLHPSRKLVLEEVQQYVNESLKWDNVPWELFDKALIRMELTKGNDKLCRGISMISKTYEIKIGTMDKLYQNFVSQYDSMQINIEHPYHMPNKKKNSVRMAIDGQMRDYLLKIRAETTFGWQTYLEYFHNRMEYDAALQSTKKPYLFEKKGAEVKGIIYGYRNIKVSDGVFEMIVKLSKKYRLSKGAVTLALLHKYQEVAGNPVRKTFKLRIEDVKFLKTRNNPRKYIERIINSGIFDKKWDNLE